jgi:hypothetical protein
MNDLELKTPAEIDVVWAELDGKLNKILGHLASYKQSARELRESGKDRDEFRAQEYDRFYANYKAQTAAERASLEAQIAPLQAEWERRGGWQRYWLCVSDGGHVHYRECHTLRWNSMIAWMPMLSGLDEPGMVEKVGFKACTHCFPTAPLHPAWVRSEAAAKKATADERLAKWEKGRAMRQKKVDNIRKRLDKAQAIVAKGADAAEPWGYSSAQSDIKWESQSLVWAERELARWDAKRPA